MSDINLFSINGQVSELQAKEVLLEKELQNMIEANMEEFFGVEFIKSEFSIKNGRIDSIGIDENNSPVIFEYKRSSHENVINQGLFYLDWLMDHKADYQLLVQEKLGVERAKKIDWTNPTVYCVANNFNKYDLHAVNQMGRNILLVRYKLYDGLILFERLNSTIIKTKSDNDISEGKSSKNTVKTHEEKLINLPSDVRDLYEALCAYIESLGDDLIANQLKFYLAYKKTHNVACIEVYQRYILLNLKLNPDDFEMEEGFSRDMRKIVHYGTGDFQITINNYHSLEKSKKYIDLAYENA